MLLLLKTLLFIIFHLGQRSYKNLGYLKLLYYHDLLRGERDDINVRFSHILLGHEIFHHCLWWIACSSCDTHKRQLSK